MIIIMVISGVISGNRVTEKNTVKKPEKPKFEVFKLKARRNETQKFHFR